MRGSRGRRWRRTELSRHSEEDAGRVSSSARGSPGGRSAGGATAGATGGAQPSCSVTGDGRWWVAACRGRRRSAHVGREKGKMRERGVEEKRLEAEAHIYLSIGIRTRSRRSLRSLAEADEVAPYENLLQTITATRWKILRLERIGATWTLLLLLEADFGQFKF